MKRMGIFALGAAGYSCIEIAVRGYTHWTMTLLGGACLLFLCRLERAAPRRPLPAAAALGAAGITAAELAVGLIVNRMLGWGVWDYTHEAFDLLGQICPKFSAYWYALCLALFAAMRAARAGARRVRAALFARKASRAAQPAALRLPAPQPGAPPAEKAS